MKSDPVSQNDKTSIQVIERMITLLDALAQYPDPVSLKELAKVTGLHPSTAHRILNDMVSKRFVDRSEPGNYRLGMRLLELGNIVKSRLNVREASLESMQTLHRKTQQPVNLSVRQGDEIVYIERAFSERSGMQVVRAIGGRAPLHLTSIGKLFLSVDDQKSVRAYATRTGLNGNNKNSITELNKLEREGTYPLYDLTVSPMTAGKADAVKLDYNETLVPGTLVQERAFSKIEVTGPLKDRTLTITLFNVKGEVLWTKELKSNLLK
jgi:DNA-binding IclR family transcriptional regulator